MDVDDPRQTIEDRQVEWRQRRNREDLDSLRERALQASGDFLIRVARRMIQALEKGRSALGKGLLVGPFRQGSNEARLPNRRRVVGGRTAHPPFPQPLRSKRRVAIEEKRDLPCQLHESPRAIGGFQMQLERSEVGIAAICANTGGAHAA